jgi:hypothetical protein
LSARRLGLAYRMNTAALVEIDAEGLFVAHMRGDRAPA